jgi:hypothetical protein
MDREFSFCDPGWRLLEYITLDCDTCHNHNIAGS